MAQPRLLLLGYDPEAASAGSLLVCPMAGPVATSSKEPVGQFFHLKIMEQQGLTVPARDDGLAEGASNAAVDNHMQGHGDSTATMGADLQPPPGTTWAKSKTKRKSVVKSKDLDYYALLGLKQERWMASTQELRVAYRKVCLECHPDKKLVGVDDPAEKENIEDHFKLVQEAYETLSDPVKRREYDSTDEFDDSLPMDCDPSDFFKVFGPAFRRNARWSVDPSAPDLGDAGSEWTAVSTFYDFWYSFKSWREFPHPDEEDTEGAESREHRRWIDRMNAKLREKGKKEEQKRLRDFVDAAYRLDPRITAKKEADRAERERKKEEKAEQIRRQQEEEKKRLADEQACRQAAEIESRRQTAEAKRQREDQKRLMKKERQRLRQLADVANSSRGATKGSLIPAEHVEKMCQMLDFEALHQLCNAMSCTREPEAMAEVVWQELTKLQQTMEVAAAEKEQQKKQAAAALKDMARREHARKMAAMREWNDEELRLLDKAVSKFPQGTPKRWEQVTAVIRTRTLEEVLLMVKEHQGASNTRMKAQEDWKGAAKKRAEVGSSADLRCEAFTDVEVRFHGEVAFAVPTETGTNREAKAALGSTSCDVIPGNIESRCHEDRIVHSRPESRSCREKDGIKADVNVGQGLVGVEKTVSEDTWEWTEQQELALVQALKQFGKELPDRWTKVAAVVPNKSKAQCLKRFKELRSVFRAGKDGREA